MASLHFTPNLRRHIACPSTKVSGNTLAEVLSTVFEGNQPARGYVLDDQGAVRKHFAIFINGEVIQDREHLSDPVADDAEIYIMQALSGG
jgi:molybdopterin synthase sulfur carrier subunit